MGAQQPYMYDSVYRDSRLPEKEFDPKAVTRASWEVKPKKPKKKGPLVSFGRHPDAHAIIPGRTYNFRPMSDATKAWIRWTRYLQLVLRAFELIAGAGLLTLMILISNVPSLTAWILRIAPGVIIICSAYAILHLARPARARPPGSSAAYQVFASITDLAILPFYAFGAITTLKASSSWETILADKALLPAFIESEYYALLTAIGLHGVSLGISIYLALMFRRIANMPPDMNPLESNLTSRSRKQHKRNKSSVASTVSLTESQKRLSTPLEEHRRSGAPYEELSRPPSIPFMHTRSNGSRDSFASSKRDSRVDLPSRQYQITPGNSPRNSVVEQQKRKSNPRPAQRGSYVEVPLHQTGDSPVSASRPKSTPNPQAMNASANASPTRVARFTEAWYASESLINRTQQRKRVMDAQERTTPTTTTNTASERAKAYEALNQRYADDDSDSDRENSAMRPEEDVSDLEDEDEDADGPINVMANMHPNPLRLNPHPYTPPRQKTPFRPRSYADSPPALADHPALAEMSPNRRSVSGSQDIADTATIPNSGSAPTRRLTVLTAWGRVKGGTGNGNRASSIQADEAFYSKPYGELRSATPPIMYGSDKKELRPVGGKEVVAQRQVSSGNDYDLGNGGLSAGLGYRRKVSGRAAEEGLAGPGAMRGGSRYDVLDE
ncbi:hypothetical protein F4777DRAFT_259549 [Nemania sp. FL0916]|nr:hypothetical protein F4777DRAFT_259549 [Nemania sp. FL0916]